MGGLTLGFFNEERNQFETAYKIQDCLENSALVIYAPQAEQDVRNMINALVAKGLLRQEGEMLALTEKGERYREQIYSMLPDQETQQEKQQ